MVFRFSFICFCILAPLIARADIPRMDILSFTYEGNLYHLETCTEKRMASDRVHYLSEKEGELIDPRDLLLEWYAAGLKHEYFRSLEVVDISGLFDDPEEKNPYGYCPIR